MLLVTMPSLIDDYNQIFNPNSSETLLMMHIVLTHSIGVFNAIVYGWQRNLFQRQIHSEIEVEASTPIKSNDSNSLNEELLKASHLESV